jgi:hypothetical protein
VFPASFILVFALLLPAWDSKAETGINENQIDVPKMCMVPEDMCRIDGKLTAEVTFYNSTPNQTDDTPYTAASGKRTKFGIVACPDNFAFGTRVQIGNHVYTCEDRKNERYRKRDGVIGHYYFDVWLASEHRALQLGRRPTIVQVVSLGSPKSPRS